MHPITLVFSGLGLPVHLDRRPFLSDSTAHPCALYLVALDLIPWSLSTPAYPRRVTLLPHLPLSVSPPFSALNVSNPLVNPCEISLLSSVHIQTFTPTIYLPFRTGPAACSLPLPKRVVSQLPGLLSSSVMLPPLPLLCCPVS